MAPSSVLFPNALATAAQSPADDTRRSKTSPGPRDRASVAGGTAAPSSAGSAGTERGGAPSPAGEGLEPDWSSTTDAATD